MQINSSPARLCKKYSHFREFEAFLTFFWHFLAIFEQKMAFLVLRQLSWKEIELSAVKKDGDSVVLEGSKTSGLGPD